MTFDKLTFDTQSNDFETSFVVADIQHQLTLCDFNEDQQDQATILAKKILEWLDKNLETSKQFASTKLLKLKNESWLNKDEQPMTSSIFIKTIELDGISAFSDGNFEIYFDDNNIFWGHSIRVDVDEDFKFESAEIAG